MPEAHIPPLLEIVVADPAAERTTVRVLGDASLAVKAPAVISKEEIVAS